MPNHIKAFVSFLILLVGVIFYYLENTYGQVDIARVGVGLSVFMVVAMWIFPEAGDRAKK